MHRPRLVLFSGLGVDHRLLRPQRLGLAHVARVHAPDYVDPQPGETIRQYSARMLERTVDLSDPEPLYLGGVSMGAMVALEAARALEDAPPAREWPRPLGVFLIGGGFSWRHIAPPVRLLGRVVGLTPAWLLRQALKLAPMMVRLVGRPDRRQRRLLLGLVRDANLKLTRWGGPAIMRWEFDGRLRCPVWMIHGGQDRLVPAENLRPDLLVPDAGHVVNVTHGALVNQFIAERITD